MDIHSTDQHQAVEQAVNILYPLFQHYGWTWFDVGVPSRDDITKRVNEAVDKLISNDSIDEESSGRITVVRNRELDSIEIKLDLVTVFNNHGDE